MDDAANARIAASQALARLGVAHLLHAMIGAVTALSDVERRLLDAIARAPDDDEPRRVLADYWLQGDDPARGELVALQLAGTDPGELLARHGERWCGALDRAGFAGLELTRGFLRHPLVLAAGDPLLADPGTRRVSPHIYVLGRRLVGERRDVHVARSARGDDVVVKAPRELGAPIVEAIFVPPHPHVIAHRDVAIARTGQAAVYAWAGEPLPVAPQPRELVVELGRQLASAVAALHAVRTCHFGVATRHAMVAGRHARLGGFGSASKPSSRSLRFPHGADVHALGYLLAGWLLGRSPHLDPDRPHRSDFDFDLPDDPELRPLLEAMTADAPGAQPPTAAEVEHALAAMAR